MKPSFTAFLALSLAAAGLSLSEALGCLAGALSDPGNPLAGALADSLDALGCTLSQPCDPLLCPLAHTLEGLIRAFANLSDGLAGPFANFADSLPGALADVTNGPLGAFTNLLHRLAALTDEMPSALAHLFGRVTDPFKQLGVAIERGQHALEDQGDVVEPCLEQHLRLNALDLQHHFSQAYVGADTDIHQIAHLRHDRHLCPQVIDLDVDLVHLDDGDVEEDVRAVGKLMRIDDRVVGELAL